MLSDLLQVVDSANQFPFGLAGLLPAPHEAAGLPVLLELAKGRLDRRAPDLVA